jgi:hypothetical protein
MMSRSRSMALALAALALTAAGCGESTKGSTASRTTTATQAASQTTPAAPPKPAESSARVSHPTSSQLIAEANSICTQLNNGAHTIHVSSLRSIAATTPKLVGFYQTAITEMKKLTPPASVASDWQAMIADFEKIEGKVLASGRYASVDDGKGTLKADVEIGAIQKHRSAIAKRDHMDGCL